MDIPPCLPILSYLFSLIHPLKFYYRIPKEGFYRAESSMSMRIIDRPPTLAFSLIALVIILHFLIPSYYLIPFPLTLFGLPLMVLGAWITIWGKTTFQRLKTPVPFSKPKKLVQTAPFSFSRNPMYLGFMIFLVGVFVIFGSVITLLAPVIFFLVINFKRIPKEEKIMRQTVGKKYINYKKKVRRGRWKGKI